LSKIDDRVASHAYLRPASRRRFLLQLKDHTQQKSQGWVIAGWRPKAKSTESVGSLLIDEKITGFGAV